MKNTLLKVAAKIGNQRHLVAIREGITSTMVIILAGSVFVMLGNLPIPAYMKFMTDSGLMYYITKISDATFGLIGISATFFIAYNLASEYKLNPGVGGLVSIASYILVTPNIVNLETGAKSFPTAYFGASGMFVGIIVSLVTVELLRFLISKNLTLKLPDSVPPTVSLSFTNFIPAMIIIFFWVVVYGLARTAGIENFHVIISTILEGPMKIIFGNPLGILVILLIQSLFWLVGVHGVAVTIPIISPFLYMFSQQNLEAQAAGEALPNIVTSGFLANIVYMGGAGTLISLAIVVLLFSKSEQNKVLGKLSIVPVSFQIAEPLLFGLPVIMNPKIAIPFVLTPVVSASMAYFSMSVGWVAKTTGIIIPWTTPPVLSGFLATGGHISGAILNIVTILVGCLIYYPFFKSYDNDLYQKELELSQLAVTETKVGE